MMEGWNGGLPPFRFPHTKSSIRNPQSEMKPLCVLTSSFCILLAGCRTAGPQVVLRDCRDCRIEIRGDLDAAQGKSVSGEIDPAVSAGVTAQANGNAVSQSGAATASPSGTYNASADATAIGDAKRKGDRPVAPTEDNATAVRATGGSPSVDASAE
jgi:uncharacterized lipoprotein YajG